MDWGNDYRCFKCWAKTENVAMCNRCWREFERIHHLDRRDPDFDIPDDLSHPTAILHIGFLSIEETAEMLERLKWKDEVVESKGPARSKIGSTKRVIEPIDRVARRVTNA